MTDIIDLGRIFYRCVDWNLYVSPQYSLGLGRIFYRCVDWNRLILTKHLNIKESHLLQMRGLKHIEQIIEVLWEVASFTDAWIETWEAGLAGTDISGRIFYRCVDWNLGTGSTAIFRRSRIFYRCVDWNIEVTRGGDVIPVASFTDAWIETRLRPTLLGRFRRIFYRCVDWNLGVADPTPLRLSRIFYRCVDWNAMSNTCEE